MDVEKTDREVEIEAKRLITRRIFTDRNVLEAALDRIRNAFLQYGRNVYVGFSGGKDSTICLALTIRVAEEMDMLPVKVMFVDQEFEWTHTADYVRRAFADPRVDGKWIQIPISMTNASSFDSDWTTVWDPALEDKWLRPKEPDSIREFPFEYKAFYNVMNLGPLACWPDLKPPFCGIIGIRLQESLRRLITVMRNGWRIKAIPPQRPNTRWYPIYDWNVTDVWKYIHDHDIPYNPMYDLMYQIGQSAMGMRVSSLLHDEAVASLGEIQELDPDLWAKIIERCPGVHQNTHLTKSEIFNVPKELPGAFDDWYEYREYLINHLMTPENQKKIRVKFKWMDGYLLPTLDPDKVVSYYRRQIICVLRNDFYGNSIDSMKFSYSVKRQD